MNEIPQGSSGSHDASAGGAAHTELPSSDLTRPPTERAGRECPSQVRGHIIPLPLLMLS